MTNNNMNLMIRDPYSLPQLSEYVKTLTYTDLMEKYRTTIEVSIISWAIRCLLCWEAYRRGKSFKEISKNFYISRQTAWRESEIWEKIISKAPELLNEPFLSKTFYKRVIEAKVENPIEELWRIADEREKISLENIERKQKGLSTVKQLSTRAYVNKGRIYICDVCESDVTKYYKICEKCKNLTDFSYAKSKGEG